MRAAATASMVSSARTNRAVRKSINSHDDQPQQEEPVQTAVPAAQNDVNDELIKLNDLKNQGIITEEEFTAKKKQLLGI